MSERLEHHQWLRRSWINHLVSESREGRKDENGNTCTKGREMGARKDKNDSGEGWVLAHLVERTHYHVQGPGRKPPVPTCRGGAHEQ